MSQPLYDVWYTMVTWDTIAPDSLAYGDDAARRVADHARATLGSGAMLCDLNDVGCRAVARWAVVDHADVDASDVSRADTRCDMHHDPEQIGLHVSLTPLDPTALRARLLGARP